MTNILEITKSGILSSESLELFKSVQSDCINSMKIVQVFRTRTEMDVSVLNDLKFPTAASKYWQAVREQSVMTSELIMLSFEYRKNEVEMRIEARMIEEEEDELLKELHQIEYERKLFIQADQRRVASARINEMINWSDIKNIHRSEMTKAELANPDNHQLISYTRRWIGQTMQMGAGASPAERQNLIGQLQSGLMKCSEFGILDEVISPFPRKVQKELHDDVKRLKSSSYRVR